MKSKISVFSGLVTGCWFLQPQTLFKPQTLHSSLLTLLNYSTYSTYFTFTLTVVYFEILIQNFLQEMELEKGGNTHPDQLDSMWDMLLFCIV